MLGDAFHQGDLAGSEIAECAKINADRQGGAHLTKLGRDVVGRYRAIEGASATACAADLRALKASLALKPFPRYQDDA